MKFTRSRILDPMKTATVERKRKTVDAPRMGSPFAGFAGLLVFLFRRGLFVVEFYLVLRRIIIFRRLFIRASRLVKQECHDASDDHDGAEKRDLRRSVRDDDHHDREKEDEAEEDADCFTVFHGFYLVIASFHGTVEAKRTGFRFSES